MILKGNQRGSGRNLAQHLLNTVENDHVEVHEIRDVAANNLLGSFLEIEATGHATPRGTTKPFYALSINPPANERAEIVDFERAANMVEKRLGLTDQPRAIVFHEKYGRRHAHVVWSRIDTRGEYPVSMRISHDRQKLMEVSHELFIRHGWDVPKGIANYDSGSPKDIRHGEWMQFRRTGIHPDEHRTLISEAYEVSDNADAFGHALKERGYILANGRRGYVALDMDGETHSVMRMTGQRKKVVEARLGSLEVLPSVEDAQAQLQERRNAVVEQERNRLDAEHAKELEPYKSALAGLRSEQRAERDMLRAVHVQREQQEGFERAQRLRTGLVGLWDRVSRRHARTVQQNAREAEAGKVRDRAERQMQIETQMRDRRALQDRLQIVLDAQMERERAFREEAATFVMRQAQEKTIRPRNAPRHDQALQQGGPDMEPEL